MTDKTTAAPAPRSAMAAASKPTDGYIHGSNLLLGTYEGAAFKGLGFSKTCSIQNKAETKDRSHKQAANTGKWKGKSVTTLGVTISAEGFSCYEDTFGYDELLALWEAGEAITLRYAHRGEEATKFREGPFVITSLEQQAPADDDATYSVTFEHAGPVVTKSVSAQ